MPTTKKVEPRTPQRDVIASTINYYRGTNGRVSAAGWDQVMVELEKAKINMSLGGVKKIGVGARPHTTDANLQHFAREGAKYGFNIIVITQSAQSPDFNYCDLAFFNSLNTDVRIQSMSNRAQITEAVKKCFAEYEADRMAGCIRSLTSSNIGCLETGGDSTYKTHRGVAKNACNGAEDFAVAKSVVDKARRALAQLKAAEAAPAPALGAAPTTTPTDQELGLDFGRFSETSSEEEEEEEPGYEGE